MGWNKCDYVLTWWAMTQLAKRTLICCWGLGHIRSKWPRLTQSRHAMRASLLSCALCVSFSFLFWVEPGCRRVDEPPHVITYSIAYKNRFCYGFTWVHCYFCIARATAKQSEKLRYNGCTIRTKYEASVRHVCRQLMHMAWHNDTTNITGYLITK